MRPTPKMMMRSRPLSQAGEQGPEAPKAPPAEDTLAALKNVIASIDKRRAELLELQKGKTQDEGAAAVPARPRPFERLARKRPSDETPGERGAQAPSVAVLERRITLLEANQRGMQKYLDARARGLRTPRPEPGPGAPRGFERDSNKPKEG